MNQLWLREYNETHAAHKSCISGGLWAGAKWDPPQRRTKGDVSGVTRVVDTVNCNEFLCSHMHHWRYYCKGWKYGDQRIQQFERSRNPSKSKHNLDGCLCWFSCLQIARYSNPAGVLVLVMSISLSERLYFSSQNGTIIGACFVWDPRVKMRVLHLCLSPLIQAWDYLGVSHSAENPYERSIMAIHQDSNTDQVVSFVFTVAALINSYKGHLYLVGSSHPWWPAEIAWIDGHQNSHRIEEKIASGYFCK